MEGQVRASVRNFGLVAGIVLAGVALLAQAQEASPEAPPMVIEQKDEPTNEPQGLAPIKIEDVRERLERAGKLKDTIIKTEVINDRKIEKKQAKTLTEAVQNEPGINAAVGCSICGMKRIQINGLRGEHTTFLVDDVPLHSTVSSYYGMDALTTAGVARIEVARGSGASLLAPGALGGVINIITQKAVSNGVIFDFSGGNQEYKALSLVGNAVSESGKRRTTVSAQHNTQGQWDVDANGVNESPRMKNYSLGLRVSDDLSVSDNADVRVAVQRSEVFGGPISEVIFGSILPSGVASFVDGDVRKAYNGAPQATLEVVNTERLEGTGKWTHRFGERANSVWTLSAVKQTQDSFYEGSDYANNNETYYSDLRFNYTLSGNHFATAGLDGRSEILRSNSYEYFTTLGHAKDDFNFLSAGAYLQDVWTPWESLEISGALRMDRLYVKWLGPGTEINPFVLVPRLHARWMMSPELTSRFSVGNGYRAPLTFFESEHGILKDGYTVQVTGIEQSTSAVYSLSIDTPRITGTASAAWTRIKDLAYVNFHLPAPQLPTLMNDPGRYDVFTADGVAGYQLTSWLTLGASYEHFFYSPAYKSLLPFAAIEDRARLMIDIEKGKLDFNLTATVVGARDLLPYRYGDRFNVFSGGVGSSPKLTRAPVYASVDLKLSWEFSKGVKLYAGVKNLFNFTQANIENALFFDDAGKYDVIHLWGPLRAREGYLGITAKL